MLEAVFLGVRGVLLPLLAFEAAVIDKAAKGLTPHGVPPEAFRAAASRRLAEKGPRALLSLSLQDLGIRLAPSLVRSVWLEAQRAIPPWTGPSTYRAALCDLAGRFETGFLDLGPPEVLDALLRRMHLDDLLSRRLWTEQLGDLARPPRGLAFRWLAQRLGARPSACLYVAGSSAAWGAARAAGWTVWPRHAAPGGEAVDAWDLVDAIDRLDGEG